MKPNELLNTIARIIFERVNRNNEGPVIAVRLGYGNRLAVPDGVDESNKQSNLNAGFISLWQTGIDRDCKVDGFREIDGETVHVSEVIYEARITVHARRCNSLDRLHMLKAEFCHPANTIDFGGDILGTPEFGSITNVSALATTDQFEDRAESILTVRFRDQTLKVTGCTAVCFSGVEKTQIIETETLCQ